MRRENITLNPITKLGLKSIRLAKNCILFHRFLGFCILNILCIFNKNNQVARQHFASNLYYRGPKLLSSIFIFSIIIGAIVSTLLITQLNNYGLQLTEISLVVRVIARIASPFVVLVVLIISVTPTQIISLKKTKISDFKALIKEHIAPRILALIITSTCLIVYSIIFSIASCYFTTLILFPRSIINLTAAIFSNTTLLNIIISIITVTVCASFIGIISSYYAVNSLSGKINTRLAIKASLSMVAIVTIVINVYAEYLVSRI